MLFLLLAVATINARAALYISNNTQCDAVLILWAHDVNNPSSCSYYSTRFTVAAGASVAFNNVTNVNAPGGPGWYLPGVGGSATMTATGSGWDGVKIYYQNFDFDIGTASACAASTSYGANVPSCSFSLATWTVLGSNILLELN